MIESMLAKKKKLEKLKEEYERPSKTLKVEDEAAEHAMEALAPKKGSDKSALVKIELMLEGAKKKKGKL